MSPGDEAVINEMAEAAEKCLDAYVERTGARLSVTERDADLWVAKVHVPDGESSTATGGMGPTQQLALIALANELKVGAGAVTRVVNIHARGEGPVVYIGRGSPWGNPFKIGQGGDRAEVIAKYRVWIMGQPDLLARLPELKGKVLACYCAPRACHGDVLVELIAERVPA